MDYKKIKSIITDNNLQKMLFNLDNLEDCRKLDDDSDWYESADQALEDLAKLGLKNMELVDNRTNNEEFYSIIHFKDEDIYIEISGEYDSYGIGNHYYNDEIRQVFPKQITTTIYE